MPTLRLFTLLTLATTAASAQQPYRSLNVDAGKVQGEVRFHTEAVVQPMPTLGGEYGEPLAALRDQRLDRVVIPVALGDSSHRPARERVAWAVFPDGNADAQEAASYDFRAVDAIIESATAQVTAAAVRFDVHPSAEESGAKIAETARRVAMHLNQGWAKSHGFGIREWRVCDQDRQDTQENAVGGANSLASETSNAIVDTLRRIDPSVSVGRCLAWSAASPASIAPPSLGAPNQAPDFYWLALPAAIADADGPRRMAEQLRHQLDGAGSNGIELRLVSPVVRLADSVQSDSDAAVQAAKFAAALVYLQDAPVASVALDLWSEASGAREEKPRAVLRAAAQLTATPHRLAVEGGDSIGYAVLAGRSTDRASIQILIANHQQDSPGSGPVHPLAELAPAAAQPRREPASTQDGKEGYDLEAANLPWGAGDFGVYCYRVDQEHNFELVWGGGGRGGSLRLRRRLPPGAVELVILQQQERPVHERLPRRRDRR